MSLKSTLYRALRLSNDVSAVDRAVRRRSVKPIAGRLARKGVGRTAGRIMSRIRW